MLATPEKQAAVLTAAEVAVFVDELSAAAIPLLCARGTIPSGYPFETKLLQTQWQDIAGLGAPDKVYLLSDLLEPAFDNASIKMAVIPNAFMLAIFNASACTGTVGSSAEFSSTCIPNMTAASDIVGMPLHINNTPAVPLTTTFVGGSAAGPGLLPPVDTSYGDDCGDISPHVTCGSAGSSSSDAGGRLQSQRGCTYTRPTLQVPTMVQISTRITLKCLVLDYITTSMRGVPL